jgi:hypothetical protein
MAMPNAIGAWPRPQFEGVNFATSDETRRRTIFRLAGRLLRREIESNGEAAAHHPSLEPRAVLLRDEEPCQVSQRATFRLLAR